MRLNKYEKNCRAHDPFVVPYEGKYYLYGTGIPNAEDINEGRQFWCYVSDDLVDWSEPILCFDAPESFWGTVNTEGVDEPRWHAIRRRYI